MATNVTLLLLAGFFDFNRNFYADPYSGAWVSTDPCADSVSHANHNNTNKEKNRMFIKFDTSNWPWPLAFLYYCWMASWIIIGFATLIFMLAAM